MLWKGSCKIGDQNYSTENETVVLYVPPHRTYSTASRSISLYCPVFRSSLALGLSSMVFKVSLVRKLLDVQGVTRTQFHDTYEIWIMKFFQSFAGSSNHWVRRDFPQVPAWTLEQRSRQQTAVNSPAFLSLRLFANHNHLYRCHWLQWYHPGRSSYLWTRIHHQLELGEKLFLHGESTYPNGSTQRGKKIRSSVRETLSLMIRSVGDDHSNSFKMPLRTAGPAVGVFTTTDPPTPRSPDFWEIRYTGTQSAQLRR